MKSLIESLFDADLTTKDIKFGDLFEFRYNSPFKTKPIIEAFLVDALKHDMKIKGRDKFEVIINGLRKIIENIPVVGSESDKQMRDKINKLIDPYLSTQYSNNPYNVDVRDDSNQHLGGYFNHLNDVDTVSIFIAGKVGVFYKRK